MPKKRESVSEGRFGESRTRRVRKHPRGRAAHAAPSEEPGNPKRIPARTQQRMTLVVKSPISSRKAEYEVALRGQVPRGVSSNHVLRRAFGDAYLKHENVRHATLLFCAFGGRAFIGEGAEESEQK